MLTPRYIIAATLLISAPMMAQDQTTPKPLICMAPAAVADNVLTMSDIATMADYGVTDLGNGVFTMVNSLEIPESITFSIEGVKTLKMGDGVFMDIDGYALFDVNDGQRVTITRTDDSAKPCGIRMRNESGQQVTFRNIDFEYTQLANAGATGFDVIGCTFSHAGSALNSTAAIAVASSDAAFNISGCTFTECEVPAIGCPANHAVALTITDCTFIDNNTSNTNKPQLNLTVGGDNDLIVRNCTLTGTGRDKVGGIAVGNLTVLPGTNRVYIDGCSITGHRYGITGVGPMYMEIRDNQLIDNCHETNAMNGGSGISLAGYNYGLDAIISGNHIERSLWGVTLIQCRDVNMGEVGNPASPGGNTFKDNGNGGYPYDLYNNQSVDVYAQLNTWSVDQQSAEAIEQVIFHRHDDEKLGEVIYMPAAGGASIIDATSQTKITVNANTVCATRPISLYNADGILIISDATRIDISNLAPGTYIATDGFTATKIKK